MLKGSDEFREREGEEKGRYTYGKLRMVGEEREKQEKNANWKRGMLRGSGWGV